MWLEYFFGGGFPAYFQGGTVSFQGFFTRFGMFYSIFSGWFISINGRFHNLYIILPMSNPIFFRKGSSSGPPTDPKTNKDFS